MREDAVYAWAIALELLEHAIESADTYPEWARKYPEDAKNIPTAAGALRRLRLQYRIGLGSSCVEVDAIRAARKREG